MREIILNEECNYIHLLSGGLDSAYSLLKIAKESKRLNGQVNVIIHPIFFDYGHFAAEVEWNRVQKIVNYVRDFLQDKDAIDDPIRISLRSDLFTWSNSCAFKGEKGDNEPEIENRNMVLFSVLSSYLIACANHQKIKSTKFKITSGFKEGELPDCNKKFFDKFSELLRLYKKDLIFDFEILESMEYQQVISKMKRLLRGNEDEVRKFRTLTTSCYSPTANGDACGKCYKCKSLEIEKMKS